MSDRRDTTTAASERLSRSQTAALGAMKANFGEASEDTLWMEGLNLPRHTMLSLERRGYATRGEYLGEDAGYRWILTEAGESHV